MDTGGANAPLIYLPRTYFHTPDSIASLSICKRFVFNAAVVDLAKFCIASIKPTQMLQRIKKFLSAKDAKASKLQVIPRDHHQVSRQHISKNALKVMYRLESAGYKAYLVGGGVRDLLLDQRPKDFDVATEATPEQVNKLFKNSRIIGRRFKINHVRFGREIIEVTTFRADHSEAKKSDQSQQSESGMLLRDNVYGSMEDDARRRDLSINALYYSAKDFSIYDYHQGISDLEQGLIRMIGEPEQRYREDPVRMLRTIRFAAKLGFQIEEQTRAPIKPLANLLGDVPAARLFDEVLKLFHSGHALATFRLLEEYDILEYLFPCAQSEFLNQQQQQLIELAMANTDARLKQGKSVTPAFLYAALLWPLKEQYQLEFMSQGMPPMAAFHEAANLTISQQLRHTAIPKRFQIPMKEIWELQLRLPKRAGNRAERLLGHPRFRAAYDFLVLRAQTGEADMELAEWWHQYQFANKEGQQSMIESLQPKRNAKRKHRGNRNRKH